VLQHPPAPSHIPSASNAHPPADATNALRAPFVDPPTAAWHSTTLCVSTHSLTLRRCGGQTDGQAVSWEPHELSHSSQRGAGLAQVKQP
jgi:hypothetical protein